MIYHKIPALLRPEAANVALSQSLHPNPNGCAFLRAHRSRFERLAAAAEELPRWPASLDILLGSAAPGSWGGREVLWPLWVDEAMHRTHSMIHLALRLECQMMQQGNRATWSASCLGKAIALAGTFAELRIIDDQEVLPCSELLGETAVRLLHRFKLPDGELEAQIVLEDIAMAAYKRRALILATSTLVMQTIINAMDRGCAPAISIKLAAQGSGQWRLAVIEDGADDDVRECDDVVDRLADLLEAQNVRRLRRMSEFVTEIDFAGLEVGPSVLPKTSQVSRAGAWAHV
jgi:hypothetical protein